MTDPPMANHLAVEEGRELVRVADVGPGTGLVARPEAPLPLSQDYRVASRLPSRP